MSCLSPLELCNIIASLGGLNNRHLSFTVLLNHFSRLWLCAALWTVARQAHLSMEFFRQEYWSGLPFPPLGDLPDPGIKSEFPVSPALQADSLPLSHQESPIAQLKKKKNQWKKLLFYFSSLTLDLSYRFTPHGLILMPTWSEQCINNPRECLSSSLTWGEGKVALMRPREVTPCVQVTQ